MNIGSRNFSTSDSLRKKYCLIEIATSETLNHQFRDFINQDRILMFIGSRYIYRIANFCEQKSLVLIRIEALVRMVK